MKTFIKLFFLFSIVALIYYGYPIIQQRYFETEENNFASPPLTRQHELPIIIDDASEEVTEKLFEEKESQQDSLKEEGKIFQTVTPVNCESECKGFSGSELQYCNEVCGLTPPKEIVSGCNSLSNLEKDYCLKDLAISKKEFTLCDQIQDENIKKTCQNRITEEILNGASENQ